MPRHISLLFPGQGSQSLGMLSSFNSEDLDFISSASKETLSFDLLDVIQSGPDDKLNQTSFTQPALLATSYLYYKKFLSITELTPNIMAGHSLGEYSALVASGSIDFKTALNLVYKRGLFMEKSDVGSMFAILNLNIETIYSICDEVRETLDEIVAPANINSANQVVIAGSHEAAALAAEKCKVAGAKRTIQLKVSVASHCNLMQSASILLSEEMKNIKFNNPTIPIIHNVDALEGNNDDDIAQKLTDQLIKPVQWLKTMEKINMLDGIVVECGPGRVLSGLAKTNGLSNILTMSSDNFKDNFNNIYG
ncbi:ACP S-malonyltransferase [Gammaproteobacteria bacterium]|nr:ACP S-malonyltransferase [Gammaproteobacteria bacterium]MDA9002942.1 ACP S-malonyltransferase [bacterium]MDA7695943.1 ACP S-malonyltransferase [Gammaproteobacteria bacterium]MDA7710427.1 ACP S-malonyltransferase [Gammaproteobacteria bacterium]MDA7800587.1 ACP S-malonyltransferase [Gammaproteobacteria bacterium]|tara:strand:- start:2942 stop:3865 length:924 start_codon:yes stop_codon:yes gene_type:complete